MKRLFKLKNFSNFTLKKKTNNFLLKKAPISFNLKYYGTVNTNANLGQSFVKGLFTGEMHTEQVFPFPQTLSEEMAETVNMIVPPTEKFFEEQVDPAKNDETANIPPEIWESMKEMGLFGLQVPQELSGVGLSNVGYARMVEIVGAHDLGLGKIFLKGKITT
jgi:hypothetical protein